MRGYRAIGHAGPFVPARETPSPYGRPVASDRSFVKQAYRMRTKRSRQQRSSNLLANSGVRVKKPTFAKSKKSVLTDDYGGISQRIGKICPHTGTYPRHEQTVLRRSLTPGSALAKIESDNARTVCIYLPRASCPSAPVCPHVFGLALGATEMRPVRSSYVLASTGCRVWPRD